MDGLRKWVGICIRFSMHSMHRFTKEAGVSMSMMGTLMRLRAGPLGVSDIADHLGISNAAASQMLERMVQQGLILRDEDPKDRRVKLIAVTPKGMDLIHASTATRLSWLDQVEQSLTPEEKKQVRAGIHILLSKIRPILESSMSTRGDS